MHWFRVDNRLIHGQIVETWLPYTHASRLLVCNDKLHQDAFHQQILLLAVPARITVKFIDFTGLMNYSSWLESEAKLSTLVLFETLADAQKAFSAGFYFSCLNIGNIHYGPDKEHICQHVALSRADKQILDFFTHNAVTLDFRCVPNDPVQTRTW